MFYSFESFLTPGIIYRVDLSKDDIEPKVQNCSVLYFQFSSFCGTSLYWQYLPFLVICSALVGMLCSMCGPILCSLCRFFVRLLWMDLTPLGMKQSRYSTPARMGPRCPCLWCTGRSVHLLFNRLRLAWQPLNGAVPVAKQHSTCMCHTTSVPVARSHSVNRCP